MTVLGPEVFARATRSRDRRARHAYRKTAGRLPRTESGVRALGHARARVTRVRLRLDCVRRRDRSAAGTADGRTRRIIRITRATTAIGASGAARLVELPLPSFPVIRLSAGSGILMRVIGFHWTMTSLRYRIRTGTRGSTSIRGKWRGRAAAATGGFRQQLFYRRAGPWMMGAVERILERFKGRTVTGGEAARAFLAARGAAGAILPARSRPERPAPRRPQLRSCEKTAVMTGRLSISGVITRSSTQYVVGSVLTTS